MREDIREKAFKTYVGLGIKRSYKEVANIYQVSQTTIFKWSKKDNWKERIKGIAREIQESI